MRRVLVGLFVGAAVLTAPTPAGADCGALPDPATGMGTADVVFVGTVVDLSNADRYARFAVEERWKGTPPDEVEVRAGPSGDSMSSIERRYELGARYLVQARRRDPYTGDDVLSDDVCTGTVVWDDSLASVRPAGATFVERDGPIVPRAADDGSPPYVMIVLTTVLVAGGCLYLLFRRGSIAYRAREMEAADRWPDRPPER